MFGNYEIRFFLVLISSSSRVSLLGMTLARCSYVIPFNSVAYLLLDCCFEITKAYQFGESSDYRKSY